MAGAARRGTDSRGELRLARRPAVGPARRDAARWVKAWPARHGMMWLGRAGQGVARLGSVRQARQAWQGVARPGAARRDGAGTAGSGTARLGETRQARRLRLDLSGRGRPVSKERRSLL